MKYCGFTEESRSAEFRVKYHGRGGPWLRRGLWREASGTTGGELIPPALVSGETRVEPVTPERTESATATEVVCCCRGGCVRGRPPFHVGATQARRTASYPEVGARVLRGR